MSDPDRFDQRSNEQIIAQLESDLQEARAERDRLAGELAAETCSLKAHRHVASEAADQRDAALRDLAEAREHARVHQLELIDAMRAAMAERNAAREQLAQVRRELQAIRDAADSATIDDLPSTTSRWQPVLAAIYASAPKRLIVLAPTAQSAPSEPAKCACVGTYTCDFTEKPHEPQCPLAAPSTDVQAGEPTLASIREAHSAGAWEDGYQAGQRAAYSEPAAQPRAEERVTHATATRAINGGVRQDATWLVLNNYITQQAELERRVRELLEWAEPRGGSWAVDSNANGVAFLYHEDDSLGGECAEEPGAIACVPVPRALVDALAELLTEPTGATTGETDGK